MSYVKELQVKITVCDKHLNRLSVAIESLKGIIPINTQMYNELSKETVSFIDQMSYRFAKLQDTAGRILQILLLVLQEDMESSPFIDVLNRAEKLGIIESAQEWISLREQRNILSHEYSEEDEEIVFGINRLYGISKRLCEMYIGIKKYIKEKGLMTILDQMDKKEV